MQSFMKIKRNKKINKIGKGKTIIIQGQKVYADSAHNRGEGLEAIVYTKTYGRSIIRIPIISKGGSFETADSWAGCMGRFRMNRIGGN